MAGIGLVDMAMQMVSVAAPELPAFYRPLYDPRIALVPMVDVPPGDLGDFYVERFTIDAKQAQAELYRAQAEALQGRPGRPIPPGEYTRLASAWISWMTDTPAERQEHLPMALAARGRVLIAGLGLGMVLQACLEKRAGEGEGAPFAVTHATVVERDPDILALVGPHYQARYGERLTLVEDDIWRWIGAPARRSDHFEAAWFDIWEGFLVGNLSQMRRLRAKARHWADWIGCWSEPETAVMREYGWR